MKFFYSTYAERRQIHDVIQAEVNPETHQHSVVINPNSERRRRRNPSSFQHFSVGHDEVFFNFIFIFICLLEF
jgi:hypothetical protein